jgi:hypothetical protein
MSSLRTLHDAFEELEQRADAAPVSAVEFTAPQPDRRRAGRLLAPAAAVGTVAAVTLVAAAITTWQHARPGAPVRQPAAHSPAPMTSHPAPTSHVAGRFQPPATPAQLAAKTRAILAGTATIVVTDTGHPVQVSVPSATPTSGGSFTPVPGRPGVSASTLVFSGAAIVGTLTASGRSGGFDLNVFLASPGSKASCDEGTDCTVHPRPDGSTLAIATWHDPAVPGGVTYQVELVRSDGADILLHVSNERDPKGESTVTASRAPLTINQMIDFVTSDRW